MRLALGLVLTTGALAQNLPLPPLPYAYDALEPHIDEATMRVHHLSHHQTYTDKTNAALAKLRADSSTKALALDAILGHLDEVPDPSIRTTLRNAGGGYVNHDMWWKSLSPTGGLAVEPRSGELHEALVCAFGSVAQFKKLFSLSALELFGSGWAWLSLAPAANCALEVGALPNQDTPLMEGKQPLLGLDVWEHAYYLKYQSRRKDYVDAFWNVVDWRAVEERYLAAKAAAGCTSDKQEL